MNRLHSMIPNALHDQATAAYRKVVQKVITMLSCSQQVGNPMLSSEGQQLRVSVVDATPTKKINCTTS